MRQWTLSLAVVALIAGISFAGPGKFNKVVSVGEKAPAISGVPAVTADGEKEITLNLADLKEDVVVVAFLANHCPAVIACEDRLSDLVKSYKGKSVKFVGVCCTSDDAYGPEIDGIPGIKKKIAEGKYNMVYGYDKAGKIGKAYGATNTPQFFVLDKERVIRYTGKLDDAKEGGKTYVKTAIDNVLAGETIEETETKAIGCGIPYKK
jgi:cytochrome oxidase Cu insertion factor (SCO1/SenC/PrrC family)